MRAECALAVGRMAAEAEVVDPDVERFDREDEHIPGRQVAVDDAVSNASMLAPLRETFWVTIYAASLSRPYAGVLLDRQKLHLVLQLNEKCAWFLSLAFCRWGRDCPRDEGCIAHMRTGARRVPSPSLWEQQDTPRTPY